MLLGGHTSTGPELQIGLVVNALSEPSATTPAPSCQPGDRLLLTRGLGSGLLFAGAMQAFTRGADVEHALDLMQSSQRSAAQALRSHQARVMTDVTGFGLVGHLSRMLLTTAYCAQIDTAALPLLPGVMSLARQGVQSSLYADNARLFESHVQVQVPDAITWKRILADPQTAGGLLAVVPEECASEALRDVQKTCPDAALIGRINDSLDNHVFC